MKRVGMSRVLLSTLFVLVLLFTAYNSYSGVPHLINYQGKLTNKAGAPLTGTYSITFKIYDVETGGTALWTETQGSVSVQNGIFNVLLGSVTSLDTSIFNGRNLYLGIKVGSDSEMTPRQIIASVGYALTAENVVGAQQSVSGRQLFTSSGTFNAPAGVTKVYVTMTGGGGGGGGGYNGTQCGGGGGSSVALVKVPYTVTPASNYTVIIGAGGTGGAWNGGIGGTGGNTSFDGAIIAQGGNGGHDYGSASQWQGGAAIAASYTPTTQSQTGTSYITSNGVCGMKCMSGSSYYGGGGGGGAFGVGGNGGTTGSNNAGDGVGYGSGGGGIANSVSSGGGGDGAPGFCLVEW